MLSSFPHPTICLFKISPRSWRETSGQRQGWITSILLAGGRASTLLWRLKNLSPVIVLVLALAPIPLALLGIAQREIKANRTPDTGMTQCRKAAPKEVKTLGDQLKRARMEKGLTQRQVSAITGIPRDRLQEIERDERLPKAEEWQKLQDVLVSSNVYNCG